MYYVLQSITKCAVLQQEIETYGWHRHHGTFFLRRAVFALIFCDLQVDILKAFW
jgi:hypothetical protein